MSIPILVIGGAGYVGAQATKLLHNSGYKTFVFDNFSTGHRDFCKWGTVIEGSLLKQKDLENAFKVSKPAAVMHFAALTEVGKSVRSPLEFYENNIIGTINLLNQMKSSDCQKIIFSSTCAVYGNPNSLPITEKETLKPINPYGFTKFAMERAFADCEVAFGLKWVALRYFNAAGADKNCEIGESHSPETHLIPIALEVAAGLRKSLSIFGNDYDTKDGSCLRDYIHTEDLAAAHLKALQYLDASKKSIALNLGIGRGHSVFEVIKAIEEVTGRKIKYTIDVRRPGDPPALFADCTLAKKTLNWEPQFIDLKIIIKHAWDWLKKREGIK